MSVFEGVVGVNMESKYDAPDRRIKFEDNNTWFGAAVSLSDDLKPGFKVKVKTEGTGRDAKVTKVKVLERTERKGGGRRGGGGGGGFRQADPDKDKRIQYQHAQKVGASLLALALETGALKLPGKGDKLGAFMTGFDVLTSRVFSDIQDQAAVARVKDETDEDTEVELDDTDLEDGDDFGNEDGTDEDDF